MLICGVLQCNWRFWWLTWVSNRNPLVELIVVRHCVKLTAEHLSEGWFIALAGFCVTGPITLPFSGAVLASKLWSVREQHMKLRYVGQSEADFAWILTWDCCTLSLQTGLQFHRFWSSATICSTAPSLRSPSQGVSQQLRTLRRYTTDWEQNKSVIAQ